MANLRLKQLKNDEPGNKCCCMTTIIGDPQQLPF